MKDNRDKLERINLVLRTVRNVNQLLVKENNRFRLIQGICDILTKNRGYFNAWIALLDTSYNLITTANSGLGKEFSKVVRQIQRGDLTHCAQRALNQSGAVLTNDPLSTCPDCPLSKNYSGRGGMTVRLEHGGKVYGLLCVSTPSEYLLDKEEQGLLDEVAGDIAFGLYRIELEERLKKSEQRFRRLVESSIMGISIIQDGKIVYQNPEQERLFGPRPRKIKFTDLESIHPEDVEKVKGFYQRVISGGIQDLDTDFRFYSIDSRGHKPDMKWVHCRTNSIEYQEKEATLVHTMDITRAKQLENILKIQDKMSSLGRVAMGIAHEIRNPLSGINIYLNTLEKIYERGGSLEKIKKILEQMQSASSKIEAVIKRVMDFSKPSEPKFILTDINRPIEEAVNLSSVTLRKIGIKIEKALTDDLPPFKMDTNMFEQVILNLITNAAEAMKNMEQNKRIEITSSMERNRVYVRVSDSGPGVPLAEKENIFDPFYTTKKGGTGIGLSLCQRIITDHGGSLDVSKSEWGGAKFVIEIPIEKTNL